MNIPLLLSYGILVDSVTLKTGLGINSISMLTSCYLNHEKYSTLQACSRGRGKGRGGAD